MPQSNLDRNQITASVKTTSIKSTVLTTHVTAQAKSQGLKGDTGATGATGATGPAGSNGVGVPAGGTTGQVLNKINGTDYNTQWSTVDKTFVGLGNVDNTSDVNKPISTATQTALNGKQATGNYITALSGDITATGPGSVAATLTNVNSNIGSFGSASSVSAITVNAKGLTTAASSVPIQITEAQVTNLVSDLAAKQGTISLTTTGTSGASTLIGNTLNIPQYTGGGGGGSGTVTSVSVTTANGVSGSVANATTTPAISLSLGAITPTSVAASGTVTGSNLSGINTGDQDLTPYALLASPTLTGDPKAPTATPGDNDTSIATTAFVTTAVANNDAFDVHLAGSETITGTKTFTPAPILSSGTTFTAITAPAYSAGKLFADSATDSLTYYNSDANVALQIGQEDWIRVVNNTGSTIANGAAVYLNGASGSMPTIALAKADAAATTIGAGLTTESIANGATGFVTSIGNVNGIDTSAFTAGATVYVSPTTAGALTATAPTAPNYRYRVGIVGVSSASVGTIHVTPSTAALGNGTANQVFGMNTAGTAQEVKSIVGTASQVTITNTANTITASLPATINVSTTGSAATLTTARTIGTLTGDVTAAGSTFNGSANNTNATVLATVNSNVGSFGSASTVATQTVNAKGLTTAAASVAIQIAESQVTNLVSDLAAKQPTVTLTTTGDGAATFVSNTLNIPTPATITRTITQTTHGFTVGNAIYHTGTTYAKSQANSSASAEVDGIVTTVVNANTFILTMRGYVTVLSGLTAGATYFLSDATAGLLTATAPSTVGNIRKPLLHADSTTSGYFNNYIGIAIQAAGTVNTKGFVNHGAVAGTARPTGFASIEWFGSVTPTNMTSVDTYYNTI